MRLLRESQVENSLIHYFLNFSVEDNNLICIASVRFSSVYTCGFPVLFFVHFCALGLCPTNSFLRLTILWISQEVVKDALLNSLLIDPPFCCIASIR